MYIIIVGCGKVGSKFASILSDEGHDVAIVDNHVNSFSLLDASFRGLTIEGVPIDVDVLIKAGIENADAFAAMTPNDNINIMACQIAQTVYKVPKVLARIYDPSREQVFHQFGLETICPTNLTVETIKSILVDDAQSENIMIAGNCINFKQIKIDKRMSEGIIKDVILEKNEHLFGLIKNGQFLYHHDDMILEKGDILVVAMKI